ncbi:MAG: hypothetical protein K2J47_09000, partial [Ruminococcus sp.]|nr:hypothetical protein [Ruminococcus sp.]
LSEVESYAKKGFTDKEIATAIGLNPTNFSEKKSEFPELNDVLSRARNSINSLVRAKFLAMALGGIKTKSITRRRLKDKDGNLLDETEECVVESELAPNLSAQATWLRHYDPEWRKVQRGEEPDEETAENGSISIEAWIKNNTK